MALKKSTKKDQSLKPESIFILGFDTEWVHREGTNHFLSYQWYAIYNGKEHSGIHYIEKNEQLSFEQFLTIALRSCKEEGGLFSHYPKTAYLVAHFSLADVLSFRDFSGTLKRLFHNVRNTYVTLGKPCSFSYVIDKHKRYINVHLYDTSLLAPSGRRLADIGELHSLKKIDLAPGTIEKMDELLANDRALYEQYAIRDAEISAKHLHYITNQMHGMVGKALVPISLGSMCIEYCLYLWEQAGIKRNSVLGIEQMKLKAYQEKTGFRNQDVTKIIPEAYNSYSLVQETYHGGRNESFFFGATPIPSDEEMQDQKVDWGIGNEYVRTIPGKALPVWTDYDLSGAYPTALSMLKKLNWKQTRSSTDISDFRYETIGFAHFTFEFPPTIKYPGLPVVADGSLVFPRSGDCYATAQEMGLAIEQGAKIKEIKAGVIVPTIEGDSPFFEVVKNATDLRKQCKEQGDELREKLYKEMINSFYGKFAQGLQKNRVFDTQSGEMKDMPPSRITNAYIASFITGMVRAVLSEIMNRLPSEVQIVSVTTDGFLTNATQEQIQEAAKGPLCQWMSKARQKLTGETRILEEKHKAHQILSWKTRGQATIIPVSKDDIILAKAGIQTPEELDNDSSQNEWIVQKFVGRKGRVPFLRKTLRGLTRIYREGGGLTAELTEARADMDFDMKRRPGTPFYTKIGPAQHIAFDTMPWQNVEEYALAREAMEEFHALPEASIKTKEDYRFLQRYLDLKINRPAGVRIQLNDNQGMLDEVKKQFLRAMRQGCAGVEMQGADKKKALEEVGSIFEDYGVALSKSDYKNAGKSAFVPNTITLEPETYSLLMALRKLFPGMIINNFLIQFGKSPDDAGGSAN